MNFKKLVVAVLAGVVLVVGVATAEAKSRVSSKPSVSRSSYSAPKVSRPAVVSRPSTSYSAPRVVTKQTPVYRSAPARTTVIQKNYYGGGNGYNRSYGGGYSGGYGGSMGGGSGLGTSIVGGAVGAAGGMLLMDALTEDEGEKALKLQQEQIRIEEARAQQERDDKQDQILENQKEEEVRQEVTNEPFFKLNPELIPAK
jgi:Predicted membrane protein